MARATKRAIVRAVLDRYPSSFADQLGIRRLDRPGQLFQLLVMSTLMSARIRASVAFDASRALFDAGWTTAAHMAESDWADRARTLNEAGYARYDERTSSMSATLRRACSTPLAVISGGCARRRGASHGPSASCSSSSRGSATLASTSSSATCSVSGQSSGRRRPAGTRGERSTGTWSRREGDRAHDAGGGLRPPRQRTRARRPRRDGRRDSTVSTLTTCRNPAHGRRCLEDTRFPRRAASATSAASSRQPSRRPTGWTTPRLRPAGETTIVDRATSGRRQECVPSDVTSGRRR